jgi:antitoxin MazE
VELEIEDNCIIIKPVKTPRQGWAEAFKVMHEKGDDSLLIEEEIDNDLLEAWDERKD